MNKARLIVDRIENGVAVCETDGVMVDIPLAKINGGVREGDILREDGALYTVTPEETEQRRTAIKERFERLKARQQK